MQYIFIDLCVICFILMIAAINDDGKKGHHITALIA